MALHLKTIVKKGLKGYIGHFVPHTEVSASHRRGVCYFVPIVGIDMLWGAMDELQKGRQRQKHIIVRRVPRYGGHVLQLYTYHFPKSWSAACIANRNLIKTAQKLAHALEHDHSLASLEWRIRFFRHYFRVFKGGAKPEPGLKPYSRFYQYTYVSIYRELKAAQQKALEPQSSSEDISFEPVSSPYHPHGYSPLDTIQHPHIRSAVNRFTALPRPDTIRSAPFWVPEYCPIGPHG